jgi:hypothetical protein
MCVLMFKSYHRPMGGSRFAHCLQGGGVFVGSYGSSSTVTITSSLIYGNTAVRAHVQKFPSPMGKMLTCLPRFTLAQL